MFSDILLVHEIRKFGTLWEVVGNSDHVFFYLKETKAKHSFVQRAPISKLKYLKGNQPSQNSPWQRLSHKQRRKRGGPRGGSSMQRCGNLKRANSQTWRVEKSLCFTLGVSSFPFFLKSKDSALYLRDHPRMGYMALMNLHWLIIREGLSSVTLWCPCLTDYW